MLVLRISIAVAPLLVALAFVWLVLQGHVDFGGGEADIFLVVPPLLWSLLYLLCCLVLWAQGFRLGASVSASAGFATGLTALGWVVLYLFSWILPD